MKRELILIRHTKSTWADADMRDFDRPLKKDRIEDASNMGKKLNDLKLKPDMIVCSPAERTKQTAEIICSNVPFDYKKLSFDIRLYESSSEEYMKVVQEIPKEVKTLAVVGHNTSITDFANNIMPHHIAQLPTTGVLWLEFNSPDWDLKKEKFYKLVHFLTPRTIKNKSSVK